MVTEADATRLRIPVSLDVINTDKSTSRLSTYVHNVPQKQEKPKFVLCVTFSENGDTITGDSSGNILVWGKGNK